jgi:hypothetical protein
MIVFILAMYSTEGHLCGTIPPIACVRDAQIERSDIRLPRNI